MGSDGAAGAGAGKKPGETGYVNYVLASWMINLDYAIYQKIDKFWLCDLSKN